MPKIKKMDHVIDFLLTTELGEVSQFVKKLDATQIETFKTYATLAEEWAILQFRIKNKELTWSDQECPYSGTDVVSAIISLWRERRKNYFDNYYTKEVINDSKHPLYSFVNALGKGIHSFEEYEMFELRWNREVIPYAQSFDSEATTLIKTTVGKLYTIQKNYYYQNALPKEIKESKEHPLHELNRLISVPEEISNMSVLDVEVLTKKTERSIAQLSEQHQKYLNTYYKKMFLKLKEYQYSFESEPHRKWKICMADINNHREWIITNRLLNEFNDMMTNYTADDLAAFKEKMDESSEAMQQEMGVIEYDWVIHEWNKHLRLIEKRLVDEKNNKFGDWLSQMRETQNLTLKELSKRTGISISYLHKLESYGKKSPSITTIRRIVNALSVPFNEVAELLELEVEPEAFVQEVEAREAKKDQQSLEMFETLDNLFNEDGEIKHIDFDQTKKETMKSLISLIYSDNFDPDRLQDSLKLIDLVKKALA